MNCRFQHIGANLVCPGCGFRMPYIPGSIKRNCKSGPQTKKPGLVGMAQHFVTDMANWAGAGFPVNTQSEHDRRLAICKGCPEFSAGACLRCGCRCNWKSWLGGSAEICPLGKWKQPETPVEQPPQNLLQ